MTGSWLEVVDVSNDSAHGWRDVGQNHYTYYQYSPPMIKYCVNELVRHCVAPTANDSSGCAGAVSTQLECLTRSMAVGRVDETHTCLRTECVAIRRVRHTHLRNVTCSKPEYLRKYRASKLPCHKSVKLAPKII